MFLYLFVLNKCRSISGFVIHCTYFKYNVILDEKTEKSVCPSWVLSNEPCLIAEEKVR